MSAVARAALVATLVSLVVVSAFIMLGRGSPVAEVVGLVLLALLGPVAVGFLGGFAGRQGHAAIGSLIGAVGGWAGALVITGEPFTYDVIMLVIYTTVVMAAHFAGVAIRAAWAV